MRRKTGSGAFLRGSVSCAMRIMIPAALIAAALGPATAQEVVTRHSCDRPCVHWNRPEYASTKRACEAAFPEMKPFTYGPPDGGRCAGEKRPQTKVNGRWTDTN